MSTSKISSLIAWFVALMALTASGPLVAGFVNGNDLWADFQSGHRVGEGRLTGEDMFKAARGLGYVEGVSDVLDGWEFCRPTNVTVGQVKDIVEKWLRDHPEKRHDAAMRLVQEALVEAFPCKKSPSR